MAILYHVRIIHSIEDYGSLQNAFKDGFVQEHRELAFAENQRQI